MDQTRIRQLLAAANGAAEQGAFPPALALYSHALALDPDNPVVLSNRSAALVRLARFPAALADALRAKHLRPTWAKAHYREGVALQCLGRHYEALAAFAAALALDPHSSELVDGLLEAASKSPLKGRLEPALAQVESLRSSSDSQLSPKEEVRERSFVLLALIGQELVSGGVSEHGAGVLESSLRVGSGNLRLKGSVHSALSSAYWALKDLGKAVESMRKDLEVAKALGDAGGEARAHGNLGKAYFAQGNFKDALSAHRFQLVLALRANDSLAAAGALTSLGHVYSGIGDFANALASHQQCVGMLQRAGARGLEGREIGHVGSVLLALGDFAGAVECHREQLRLAEGRGEEGRALAALGAAFSARRHFGEAMGFLHRALAAAKEEGDKGLEGRCYAGLGGAARGLGQLPAARTWHAKELDVALESRDKSGEGRAAANLALVFGLLGDQEAALKLHRAALSVALSSGDRPAAGRAYGNIGNCLAGLGLLSEAVECHQHELAISKEVGDRAGEAATHGNLGAAWQGLGHHQLALSHYSAHLSLSREQKDVAGEAVALVNLGNCHAASGAFAAAIPFYENFLALSQEVGDLVGERRGCDLLGFAHFSIGNFREALRYYEHDLALAPDSPRPHCNRGLALLALGDLVGALSAQRSFLSLASDSKTKLKALANVANVLLRNGDAKEALKMSEEEVELAKEVGDPKLIGGAYGGVAAAHRRLGNLEEALKCHEEEVTVFRDAGLVGGEARGLGRIGHIHLMAGRPAEGVRCFQQMAALTKDSPHLEIEAAGKIGEGQKLLGQHDEAAKSFRRQLSLIDSLLARPLIPGTEDEEKRRVVRAQALRDLGSCLADVGQQSEAAEVLRASATLYGSLGKKSEEAKALGILGRTQKLSDPELALETFRARTAITRQLAESGDDESEMEDAQARVELGKQLLATSRWEEAATVLENGISIARRFGREELEAEGAAGLVEALSGLGRESEAVGWAEIELSLAKEDGKKRDALLRLGGVREALGEFDEALDSFRAALELNAQNPSSRAPVLVAIGRVEHGRGRWGEASGWLSEGLSLLEGAGGREAEAEARHFLGLSLWRAGDLEGAESQLRAAADLLDAARAAGGEEVALKLFERQAASFEALQHVLVASGQSESALVVAERSRRSARRGGPAASPSLTHLLRSVDRAGCAVLYFSISGPALFAWLILPDKGVVGFSEERAEDESMAEAIERETAGGREALDGAAAEEDLWTQHVEELGERLNGDCDRGGFLRMVSRNSRLTSSSYSLSSLFSVASGGSVKSGRGGRRRLEGWEGPSALRSLYKTLVGPFEDQLEVTEAALISHLAVVGPRPLLLVPWHLLRPHSDGPSYLLGGRFRIHVAPALAALTVSPPPQRPSLLLVANPAVPPGLATSWGWGRLPRAQAEAEDLVTRLGDKGEAILLSGSNASKESFATAASSASAIQIGCHVSWGLGGLVLAGGPEASLSDVLLTAGEILSLRLSARLVVLTLPGAKVGERASPESILAISNAFIAAGARSVLVCQWRVPDGASALFLQRLWASLLAGGRASEAVGEATDALRESQSFSHPANWAGYVLIGADSFVVPSPPLDGFKDLVLSPDSRDALRVCLHLVEKSLQRMRAGLKNAMYTTEQSIEKKVGGAPWRPLLASVGFRFEQSPNLPPAVFFPQVDPAARLARLSAALQAILGLSVETLEPLLHLLEVPRAGPSIIQILRECVRQSLGHGEDPFSIGHLNTSSLTIQLLRSLGAEVDRGRCIGTEAATRACQLALRASLSLFLSSEFEEFLGGDGAFKSFVRSRGEPDGEKDESSSSSDWEPIGTVRRREAPDPPKQLNYIPAQIESEDRRSQVDLTSATAALSLRSPDRRDDGDGRSLTESQYGSYSPATAPPLHNIHKSSQC